MDLSGEPLGKSPAMKLVLEKVSRLIQLQSGSPRLPPILILGDTGTGKGFIAEFIHRKGQRSAGPFVAVNCAAIPEQLLEAEMFGFERGAFTDAKQAKPGLFQAAHTGTIFRDEVGELSQAFQAKLLKAIDERAVRRLGSTRSEPVNVSIIAATNLDLAALTRAGKFREDLYHRLAVLTLWLPPRRGFARSHLPGLREIGEEIRPRCADYPARQSLGWQHPRPQERDRAHRAA